MSRFKPQHANLDRLVSADPFERLLATLDAEIGLRTRRFTHPQASLELELLKSFRAEVEETLRDARAADVIGNVKDAARLAKRPESTVRRICGKHKARAGASILEGEWSIHLPTFLRFIASLPGKESAAAVPAAKPAETSRADQPALPTNDLEEAA